MEIYVDFDDCLCETARYISGLAAKMFGTKVPYEQISFFDLQKSFSITREQYEQMMIEAHKMESLLAIEETPGACETLNAWTDVGHNVYVITGRPYSAFDASREWLDRHGLNRVDLYCLDKYGRDSFIRKSDFNLKLDDFYKMHFDLAVEDSTLAFRFFEHLPDLKVCVYERPWNRSFKLPSENYRLCPNWASIREFERSCKSRV
ncbi:MAG: 2-dehydropantoate 2-reductase [Lachnospiraceae bacterium]|nr:2-dehydropantoate 2-reductase [Lachnospiraceae bacterium]